MPDHQLYAAEGAALAALSAILVIWFLSRAIGRARPDLKLWHPLLAAFLVRVVVAGGLALTSLGGSLRGGDETVFIADAHYIGTLPLTSGTWLAAVSGHLHFILDGIPQDLSGSLHVFVMSLEVKLFDASNFAMRITMAGIAVVGLALIALAVNELAGPRAAKLTAWLLAFEPANIFFSTALHKEPLLYLAEGMVALGGAMIWRRARLLPVCLLVVGCLVATATRPYVGWFLGAGSAALLLHAALRSLGSRRLTAVGLTAVVLVAGVVAAPRIATATSNQELKSKLQSSQSANATDTSNLKLAPIDFSSRAAIARNLPGRMFDVMFRPFPWQISDTSQQFGLIETLCVLAAVFLLVCMAGRMRAAMRVAGPLIYPAFVLLVAYSLASGNAGTSFRYRTHIVALLIAIVVALRAGSPKQEQERRDFRVVPERAARSARA